MKAAARVLVVVSAVLAGVTGAQAQQWPVSALALRTNGGVVKAGECVRLSLVATEDVSGPLTPTVSYSFDKMVTVEDEDKRERTEIRRVTVRRPAAVTLEHVAAGASVMLDDSFCFGQGTQPGAYGIAVGLASFGLPASQLATCVEFHGEAAETPATGRCELAVRGVLRRDPGETVVFDTVGAGTGLNRLLVMRDDRLLRVVQDGLAATGSSELSVSASAFVGLGTAPVDLVLHDQAGHRSATIARLVLGR